MDGLRFEDSILTHFTPKSSQIKKHLYHIKLFVSTINDQITDDSSVYIGSHNFTKQAWGKVLDRSNKFQVNNTELGVLFGPGDNTKAQKQKLVQNLNFKIPSKKYSKNDLPYIPNKDP